jgi:hypothetical protein
VDANHRRSREAQLDPLAQHLVERAEAEPPELDHGEAMLGDPAAQQLGRLPAYSDERRHRLRGEAREREAEGGEGGGVEPLDVVDRHEHRPFAREGPQSAEERRCDRALVHGGLRLAE